MQVVEQKRYKCCNFHDDLWQPTIQMSGREEETYRMVRDKVMDIMTALPPSYRKATAKVGDKHANQGISDEVVGDASMTCVMGCKHYLMLQSSAAALVKYFFLPIDLPKTIQERRPKSSTTHTGGR